MIDFVDTLETKGTTFIDVVAHGDQLASVPCCPEWRLRDLALHQGRVWQWARTCIEAGEHVERSDEPVADDDMVQWLTTELAALVALLRATDPGTPTWTFGPKPRTVGFWRRRQAQEVTVHLWDAQSSVGPPTPLEDEIAADGVAEVFEVLVPRQVRLERMAEVADGVRIVLPDGRTFDLGERPVGEVTGTPGDLLLALWHRVPLDSLTISGDAAAVREAFDRAITP